MVDAVIVSTARTGIGRAYRGWLNNTEGATLAGHVIGEAVRRAELREAIQVFREKPPPNFKEA